MNLCLETETFLFAVCFGKKNLKSYETEDRFFLHETTKLAILVFLAQNTTNFQRKKSKKHETWSTLLSEQRKP